MFLTHYQQSSQISGEIDIGQIVQENVVLHVFDVMIDEDVSFLTFERFYAGRK